MSHTHTLSRTMAIIIGINAIIGAGIFFAPAKLQIAAGPAGIVTYLVVIAAVLGIALSLARVAFLYPEKGAFYAYAKAWGGHVAGVMAIGCYLIGLVIALGLLARITGIYLNIYVPCLSPVQLGIVSVIGVVLANLAGAVLAQAGQIVLIVLLYIPLILIAGMSLMNASLEHLTPFAPEGVSGILSAIPAVIFGFFGFEAILGLFSHIENPEKNVPSAVTITILCVGATYLAFAGSILIGLPRELFTSPSIPLSTVLLSVFPQATWLASVIDWSIIITIIGTLHAMIWAISSMIVNTYHTINPHTRPLSQKRALYGLGCAVVASCIFLTSIDLLFNLTALFIVAAYAAASLPLLLLPKGRSTKQIIIGMWGLVGSALIVYCGISNIITLLT